MLCRFVENLVDGMYPGIDRACARLGEYLVEEATAGYSVSAWKEREFSGSAFFRLARPRGRAPAFQHGCYTNTNPGLFAVWVAAGFISEIEMHFYTRQAPPFLPEILTKTEGRRRDDESRKILQEASVEGFFDTDDFFQSVADSR